MQWTDEVNEITGKGRHSTTARELIVLPGGGILIDNPGIREVHRWTDETTLRERLADIAELAAHCKFTTANTAPMPAAPSAQRWRPASWSVPGHEGFQKLEAEIEKLHTSRKKRQMTGDRHLRPVEQSKSPKHAERGGSIIQSLALLLELPYKRNLQALNRSSKIPSSA